MILFFLYGDKLSAKLFFGNCDLTELTVDNIVALIFVICFYSLFNIRDKFMLMQTVI